jgi:hypothetical protein
MFVAVGETGKVYCIRPNWNPDIWNVSDYKKIFDFYIDFPV